MVGSSNLGDFENKPSKIEGLACCCHSSAEYNLLEHHAIPEDIKLSAMCVYKDNILSKPAILDDLQISSWTFDQITTL